MNRQCLRCKGRRYCGRSFCAHAVKLASTARSKGAHTKKDFQAASPAPFVGRFGYPRINVGLLTPPDDPGNEWEYDAPRHWAEFGKTIPEIVDLRSALLNNRKAYDVVSVRKSARLLDIAQEAGLAEKPVDVEISLEDSPRFSMSSDPVAAPTGPKARVEKARLTSNTKVCTAVERVFSDTDRKAVSSISYLYSKGKDENFLSRMLSVGTMGVKKSRKLVPTRWSITAVDDIISKEIVQSLSDAPCIDEHTAFYGSYLGNHYVIMFYPSCWRYELFETLSGDCAYTTDYENFNGRKDYADNCAGGYYSVRLAVAEKLKSMKRQASVVAIRVITGDYAIPLGVWVTREAARKALSNPIKFSGMELMHRYCQLILEKKAKTRTIAMIRKSFVVKELMQPTLRDF